MQGAGLHRHLQVDLPTGVRLVDVHLLLRDYRHNTDAKVVANFMLDIRSSRINEILFARHNSINRLNVVLAHGLHAVASALYRAQTQTRERTEGY